VEKINNCASKDNKTKVYIEVNISGESTKTGCEQKDIFTIAEQIIKSPRLELVGIMSLGNVGNEKEFEKMIKIKEEICEKYSLDKENLLLHSEHLKTLKMLLKVEVMK